MQKLRWVLLLAVGCSSPAPDPVVLPPPTPPPAVLQTHRPEFHREPVAPWSLTASDGSGLQLVSVEAKAVIEGPLAFTELHLRFHNPEDRVREGTRSACVRRCAACRRRSGDPREGGRKSVQCAGLSDSGERLEGPDHLVQSGARECGLLVAARRLADDR
ncbi:MAG TPA: hypothetical protein VF403_02065 [Kofleriaceae bacterium]